MIATTTMHEVDHVSPFLAFRSKFEVESKILGDLVHFMNVIYHLKYNLKIRLFGLCLDR